MKWKKLTSRVEWKKAEEGRADGSKDPSGTNEKKVKVAVLEDRRRPGEKEDVQSTCPTTGGPVLEIKQALPQY